MMETPLIPHDDQRFEEVTSAAHALFEAAMRMGMAEAPESAGGQAFHFAVTALLNVAEMEEAMAVKALGAVCGTTATEYADPGLALAVMMSSAQFFLKDALERRVLVYGAAVGKS